MITEKFSIEGIPAVLWGVPSDKIYIYVHGKQGYKEYAEAFAKVAETKGYQMLKFRLVKFQGETFCCAKWRNTTSCDTVLSMTI